MSYLDNQPESGVTDGSNINADVFTANSITVNGAASVDSLSIVDGDFAITATNASPSQANAYAITKDYNVVSVSAGHGDAVRLPVPTVGRLITIVNNGAKDAGVYPSANCAIDDFGTNAVYYLASGSCQRFVAVSTTKWTRLNRGLRFVMRGSNSATADVDQDSLTMNATFQEFSLASVIPPSGRSRPADVAISVNSAFADLTFYLTDATQATWNVQHVQNRIANRRYRSRGSVYIDPSGNVGYYINAPITSATVFVCGWNVEG